MKHLLGFGATVLLSAAAATPHIPAYPAMGTQRCVRDSALLAAELYQFREMVSDTGELAVLGRQGYQLPAMDSTKVTVVTHDAVCAKAIVTINRFGGAPDTTSRSIVLIKLDTAYVARDPKQFAGEFAIHYRMNHALDSVLVTPIN
ncbi:MAG: hypothetical protein V4558_06365 [Gemmatimonadota bacterium]